MATKPKPAARAAYTDRVPVPQLERITLGHLGDVTKFPDFRKPPPKGWRSLSDIAQQTGAAYETIRRLAGPESERGLLCKLNSKTPRTIRRYAKAGPHEQLVTFVHPKLDALIVERFAGVEDVPKEMIAVCEVPAAFPPVTYENALQLERTYYRVRVRSGQVQSTAHVSREDARAMQGRRKADAKSLSRRKQPNAQPYVARRAKSALPTVRIKEPNAEHRHAVDVFILVSSAEREHGLAIQKYIKRSDWPWYWRTAPTITGPTIIYREIPADLCVGRFAHLRGRKFAFVREEEVSTAADRRRGGMAKAIADEPADHDADGPEVLTIAEAAKRIGVSEAYTTGRVYAGVWEGIPITKSYTLRHKQSRRGILAVEADEVKRRRDAATDEPRVIERPERTFWRPDLAAMLLGVPKAALPIQRRTGKLLALRRELTAEQRRHKQHAWYYHVPDHDTCTGKPHGLIDQTPTAEHVAERDAGNVAAIATFVDQQPARDTASIVKAAVKPRRVQSPPALSRNLLWLSEAEKLEDDKEPNVCAKIRDRWNNLPEAERKKHKAHAIIERGKVGSSLVRTSLRMAKSWRDSQGEKS